MKYKRIVEVKCEPHWDDETIIIIPKRKWKDKKEERRIRRRVKRLSKKLGF